MRDVAFEWSIPYVLSRKQKCFRVLLIAETIIFLFNSIFLVTEMIIAAIALAVISYFLFRSWKIEYEYEYVNGDLTISKIIRKEDRKELCRVNPEEMEELLEGKHTENGKRVRDFTSNRPDVPVYTLKTKNDMIFMEPNTDFLQEMKWRLRR